jgi:signal transduction histidine kinase
MPDAAPAPAGRETLTPTLRVWRTRALYALLTVIAVAGLPAYVAPLINARASGTITPILWAYLGIYVAFVALALAPSLPESTRAFGLMGLAYANGIASMARLGLAGSGRLYLLVMPVVAALLLGARAGYISAAVSLGIYAVFTYLAGSGQLASMLTQKLNPTSLADWLEAGLAFAVFLLVLAVLVERFAALLVRALRSQQRTSNELAYTARTLREREEVLVRQKDTLAALHETAVGVASARDVQGLLAALVERSVSLASAAYGWLYLVDTETDELVAAVGTGSFQKHIGVRLKRGEGLSGQIWAESRPMAIDNYRFWQPRSRVFEGEPIGPAMGVPLYVDGQVTGVIGLTRLVYSKPFTPDELDAMTRLAELAGILLTNARLRNSLEQELAARVEAQAALQVAYEGLEQRVQERTAELAALHAEERERRAEAERSRRIADGLREIVAALNAQQSLAETLGFIVSHACRMLRSDGAAIFRLEQVAGGEPMLTVQSGCGLEPSFVESAALPYATSLAGRSLRESRAIPVPNIRQQLQLMSDDLAPSPYLQRPEMQRLMASFTAMLLMPLTVGRQPYGVMALYYRKSRSFTEEDVAEAQSLADQTALAIESASLREQAGEAAALDERNRLARELHDSVTQSLYSVTLYAEAAARQLEAGNEPAVVDHLRELRDTSRDALREMRLLIYELRPPEIERTGLAAALRGRLQAVENRGGVRAELIQDGDENIPAASQQELYHIAREALNNSLKHSLATHLVVRLHYRADETVLEIEDDGAGFDSVEGMEAGGMGLRTMRERAQRIGATLDLRTARGAGTTVRVIAPLR